MCSVAVSKFPKSEASPVDAILTKSITSLIGPGARSPPLNIPRVSLPDPPKYLRATVKLPKSTAYPVVNIVT